MAENFKKQYRDLEMRVHNELRTKIQKSKVTSKTHDTPVIKVNVFDYTELAVINDKLTFLDAHGYHYSIYAEASLEDLIDILNK
jgi:hypothetical protein